ncbi:MAG: type IX secretion system PorP/SprF family membrane protein [Polaribacter sp.]|jgi:type IX secretion system PorP/SprF family membrane protein
MKNIFTLLLLVGMIQMAEAQDEAVFTHHAFNPTLVNPAAAGFDASEHNLFLNFRSAFSGFAGAPKNYALSYNGPVLKQIGLGAMIYSESIAGITHYRAQLSYAFNYSIEDVKVALGLSTEMHRMRIDNDELNNPLNDPDEVLQDMIDGKRAFDATAGVYAGYKDKIYVGASFPSLVRSDLDDIAGKKEGVFSTFVFLAGGCFDVNDYKVKIQPQILIKKVRTLDLQTDINLIASFLKEQLITGVSYRTGTGNSAGIMLGTKYSNLRFIYSYDVYLNDFQQYNGGSHEVTVNFEFGTGDGKFDRSKKYRK